MQRSQTAWLCHQLSVPRTIDKGGDMSDNTRLSIAVTANWLLVKFSCDFILVEGVQAVDTGLLASQKRSIHESKVNSHPLFLLLGGM
jgi:hypothetical protein